MLGEEGTSEAGASGLRWVIDPLDGTVNYLYRQAAFCVSIACEDAEGGLVAVVHQPTTRRDVQRAPRRRVPTRDGAADRRQPAGVARPRARRHGLLYDPARACAAGRARRARCCRRCATSAAPARRRSISPGSQTGASTATTSTG